MFEVSDFIDDLVEPRQRTLTVFGVKLPWPFPISYGLGGSSAMVFGYPVYGAGASWLIRQSHRAFYAIQNAKYWLYYRLHPRHRYHIIDTGLDYGYHERDDAIACVLNYAKDCEHTGVHDPGDQVRSIITWWNEIRPADQRRSAQLMHELYGGKSRMKFVPVEGQPRLSQIVFDPLSDEDDVKQKELWVLDDKIRADEQAFLHLAVDARPGMWT